MPFDEDDESEQKKPGLNKLSGQKSMFANQPKKPNFAEFEQSVSKAENSIKSDKQEMGDLTFQFLKIMKNKTLEENKTTFERDLEREILQKIVNLSTKINNDPIQKEGEGSMACIALALRTCFLQRSRINELEYKLSQVKKPMTEDEKKNIITINLSLALDKLEKK